MAARSRRTKCTHGSRSRKAGLQLPVGRIHSVLKQGQYVRRISNHAPVYLAAALEYLVKEAIELATETAKDYRMSYLNARHFKKAFREDTEMTKVLKLMTNFHSIDDIEQDALRP